jgi:hypothetical protein
MKKLFVAVLFAAGVAGLGTAQAWDGCGVGCHTAPLGGCVVDGWETATPISPRNECPVYAVPRPSCPFGYVWRNKYRACFAAN